MLCLVNEDSNNVGYAFGYVKITKRVKEIWRRQIEILFSRMEGVYILLFVRHKI